METKKPDEPADPFDPSDRLLGQLERNAAISWPVPLHELVDQLARKYYDEFKRPLPRKLLVAAILYSARNHGARELDKLVASLAKATVADALPEAPKREKVIWITRPRPGPRVLNAAPRKPRGTRDRKSNR